MMKDALEAVVDKPGLWISRKPDANGGVHALMIGISNYPHLTKGSGPVGKDIPSKLGQLSVSARTGAELFAWLNKTGRIGGIRIKSCRLLLGPSPDEVADVTNTTHGHYAVPTFSEVERAMKHWGDELYNDGHLEKNTAFFFFSGHGAEISASSALMCMDILEPSKRDSSNRAVSTVPLQIALKNIGARRAFMLFDACRNAPDIVRKLNISGQEILKPAYVSEFRGADAVMWLNSTESGAVSYQAPTARASIFGEAVLDAVEGISPWYKPYDVSSKTWKLSFGTFESYVKLRASELLRKQDASKVQNVKPGGDPIDYESLFASRTAVALPHVDVVVGGALVKKKAKLSRTVKHIATAQYTGRDLQFDHMDVSQIDDVLTKQVISSNNEQFIAFENDRILEQYDRVYQSGMGGDSPSMRSGSRSPLRDFGIMHEALGHESLTSQFVKSFKAYDLSSRKDVHPRELSVSDIYINAGSPPALDGDVQSINALVDLEVLPARESPGVLLLQLKTSDNNQSRFGVALPRDADLPMPVRLEISAVWNSHGTAEFSGFSAYLGQASNDSNETGAWPKLWQIQQRGLLEDLATAGKAVGLTEILENILKAKHRSPIAAAIAAAQLLQAGQLESLYDWPKNLANRFPHLADGPILWSETLIRRAQQRWHHIHVATKETRRKGISESGKSEPLKEFLDAPEIKEARQFFERIADLGAPVLLPTLEIAIRQLGLWQSMLKEEGRNGYPQLAKACQHIDSISRLTRNEGLFLSLAYTTSLRRIIADNPGVTAVRKRGD